MEDQFWVLITKYLSNEASESDINTLFSLLESDDAYQVKFNKIVKEWNVTGNIKPHSFTTKIARQKLFSEIEEEEKLKKPSFRSINVLLKIAAMAAILFWGYYFVNQQFTQDTAWREFRTAQQEKLQLVLPDSTIVWLNENSILSYNFSNTYKRQIKLSGEAFFDVKRDEKRPFSVQSEHFTTEVLGTSFNIDSRNEKNSFVSVVSGKVAVQTSEENEILLLTRGDKISYDVKTKKVSKEHILAIDNEMGWIDKKFIFDNIPLEDALRYISKAYDIIFEVQNEKLNTCLIKGTFHKESLSNMLKVICSSLDCKYKIQKKNRVVVSGNGC